MTVVRSIALAVAGVLAAGASAAAPGDGNGSMPKRENKTEAATEAGIAGQKAYVDPRTGELVSSPARPERAPMRSLRVDPAGRDLPEMPLANRPGFKVDLKGRYQSATVATVNPDGSVSVSCDAATASVTPEAPHAR